MIFKESEKVECKSKYVEDIRKEIIAFANSNGGSLYIGVEDDGNVIGVDDSDSILCQISNSVRDSIKPDITLFISLKTLIIDQKDVIQIDIERGSARPYYIASKGLTSKGVYVRQGSSSAPASEEAIRKMIKESDGDHFESMRSLEQELTFDELQRAFQKKKLNLETIQMKSLGLINEENLYTNLALILSDQCPHIIKAATFSGIDQNHFHDRIEFSGSLLKQLSDAYAYLQLRNSTQSSFQGLYRIDTKDYSDEALREMLLNAIVHREYSNLASTILSVYENRIECINYGGLAGNITIEDVLLGLSVCRNPKLANIFYRLDLIEAYGTGIQKICSSYQNISIKPQFLVAPTSFKVILPNCNSNVEYSNEDKPLLSYIEQNKEVRRKDIETFLGVSSATAVRIIKKLLEEEQIVSIGQGKNIRYIRKKG